MEIILDTEEETGGRDHLEAMNVTPVMRDYY